MNSTNSRNQSTTNGSGLFIILTFIFLSISVWQTSKGYELMFGIQLAWIFSFAIGLMMLFLSFEMRKRRLSGYSAIGPLCGYIACAIFCFFGNFNAIYSRYNRDELFKKELLTHKQELVAVETAATAALQKADSSFLNLKTKVYEHRAQLILQINDPANLGLGPKARDEVAIIEALLGEKLTEFSGTPAQRSQSYSNNIESILNVRLSKSIKVDADKLIEKIKTIDDTLQPIILDALKPQNISSKGQDAIFKTVDAINSIGEETKNLLGTKNFSFQEAEFENQEIGKISHTFSSAFNGNNSITAIICLLVAIAIDALVPFVIFVGTKRHDDEDNLEITSRKAGGVQIIR